MTKQSKSALLIVDVQNDFCPGGALSVRNGDLVVQPLNNMVDFFRQRGLPRFFSADRHPDGTKHFKEFGGVWPVHCIRSTWGAQFHPNLHFEDTGNDYLIYKGEGTEDDGYSPFEGNYYAPYDDWQRTTAYHKIPLNILLANLGVKELYIGGLATDYCVKHACLDAKKLGYETYLLLDACRAVNLNPDDEAGALEDMNDAGVIITTTKEVLSEAR